MATHEQLRERLFEIAQSSGPAVSNIAKVEEVNEEKATCVLLDENGEKIFNVRLRPVLTGKKSFLQIPKKGSLVLAIRVEDNDDWMVVACDELEKISWTVKEKTIVELTDKIHIGSGGENLATLIEDLFKAISNMVFTTNNGPTIKLVNQAEFDALKNKFKTLLI